MKQNNTMTWMSVATCAAAMMVSQVSAKQPQSAKMIDELPVMDAKARAEGESMEGWSMTTSADGKILAVSKDVVFGEVDADDADDADGADDEAENTQGWTWAM